MTWLALIFAVGVLVYSFGAYWNARKDYLAAEARKKYEDECSK